MRSGVTVFAACLGLFLLSSNPARAQPETPEGTVAVGELIAGTEAYLAEHPADGAAHIQLGLLHCHAYGYGWGYLPEEATRLDGERRVVHGLSQPPIHSTTLVFPVPRHRLRNLAEAMHYLQRGVALAPEDYFGQLALGYAYMHAGRRNLDGFLDGRVDYDAEAAEALGGRQYWDREALAVLRGARGMEEAQGQPGFNHGVSLACLYTFQILGATPSPTTSEVKEMEAIRECALKAANATHRLPSANGEPQSLYNDDVPEGTLREILALYPLLPDHRNGAAYYLHAADAGMYIKSEYDAPLPLVGSLEIRVPVEPFSGRTMELMGDYLARRAESLRMVREAAEFSTCRYPIDFRDRLAMSLPHLAQIRQLARLLAVQALYAAERDDVVLAAQSIQDTAGISLSLRQEPLVISQLVRMACTGIAVHATEQVVNRVTLPESYLLQLQEAIDALELDNGLVTGLAGERWLSAQSKPNDDAAEMEVIEEKTREIYREKGVEEWHHHHPRPDYPELHEITVSEDEKSAMEAKLRLEYAEKMRVEVAAIDRYLEIARLPVEQIYDAIRITEEADPEIPTHRVRNPYDTNSGFLISHVRTVSSLRVTQVALAVERYFLQNGELPESIQALSPAYLPQRTLVDPFGGDWLKFEVLADRYVVYSAGEPRGNARAREKDSDSVSGISFTVMF